MAARARRIGAHLAPDPHLRGARSRRARRQARARAGPVCRRRGGRLRDENCWFSYETKLALWRAAEEVLDDPHVAEHVGEAALDLSVAMGLKRTLRALGTPGFVYGNVVRANAKFNWAHELVVIDSGAIGAHALHGHLRRRLSPLRLRIHERACWRRCRSCSGCRRRASRTPSAAPAADAVLRVRRALDRRHARPHGAPRSRSPRAPRALARAGALADPVLVPVAAGILVAGEAALAARAMRFMHRRLRVLEQRVREQDDAAERLLSSLRGPLLGSAPGRGARPDHRARRRRRSAARSSRCCSTTARAMRADRHSGIPSAVARGPGVVGRRAPRRRCASAAPW